MSSEPKKPIEQMLEASAEARRAAFGSDPKMPNPMRARLHDEISRVESEDGRKPSTSWSEMFWPRLGFAAALATLLVIGPFMWWRASHPATGGMIQVAAKAPAAPRADSSADSVAASPAPEDAFAKGPAASASIAPEVNLADTGPATLEPEATPASAATSLESSNAMTSAQNVAASKSELTKDYAVKVETPSAPAAPASAAITRSGDVASAARSEKFVQQSRGQEFRNTAQTNQAANILSTFQVQQQGTDIRVVDADGSTYVGKLEAAPEFADRGAAKTRRSYAAKAEADHKTEEPSPARFRASGYNVSLKKSLVFEGNYVGPTQPDQRQKAEQTTNEPKAQQKDNTTRIIGTARVHGERPVEVDATAVTAGEMAK